MLRMQKAVAVLMSFLLVLTTFPVGASAQNTSPSGTRTRPSREPERSMELLVRRNSTGSLLRSPFIPTLWSRRFSVLQLFPTK